MRRWPLFLPIAAILATVVFSGAVLFPVGFVYYHLGQIADGGDIVAHVDSISRMGRRTVPALLSWIEADPVLPSHQAAREGSPSIEPAGNRTACVLALTRAYDRGALSSTEAERLMRAAFAVDVAGLHVRTVPCLKRGYVVVPHYFAATVASQPSLEFEIEVALIIDGILGRHVAWEPNPRESSPDRVTVVSGPAELKARGITYNPEFPPRGFVTRVPVWLDLTRLPPGRHTGQLRVTLEEIPNDDSTNRPVRIEFRSPAYPFEILAEN